MMYNYKPFYRMTMGGIKALLKVHILRIVFNSKITFRQKYDMITNNSNWWTKVSNVLETLPTVENKRQFYFNSNIWSFNSKHDKEYYDESIRRLATGCEKKSKSGEDDNKTLLSKYWQIKFEVGIGREPRMSGLPRKEFYNYWEISQQKKLQELQVIGKKVLARLKVSKKRYAAKMLIKKNFNHKWTPAFGNGVQTYKDLKQMSKRVRNEMESYGRELKDATSWSKTGGKKKPKLAASDPRTSMSLLYEKIENFEKNKANQSIKPKTVDKVIVWGNDKQKSSVSKHKAKATAETRRDDIQVTKARESAKKHKSKPDIERTGRKFAKKKPKKVHFWSKYGPSGKETSRVNPRKKEDLRGGKFKFTTNDGKKLKKRLAKKPKLPPKGLDPKVIGSEGEWWAGQVERKYISNNALKKKDGFGPWGTVWCQHGKRYYYYGKTIFYWDPKLEKWIA
jgi:hypothetical protein